MKKLTRFAALGLLALVAIGGTGCTTTPESGEIGVVRNGKSVIWPIDWFDNHNIRGIVPNGSGASWAGLGSDVHYYPASNQQRFFKMLTCYGSDSCGADANAVTVPTSDGVEVTIEGTIYLNTAFENPAKGEAPKDTTVGAFDTQFATRTFGSDDKHAYDGTKGWSAFLAAIVEPIVVNNLRETVSGISCAELVSSCALVQNNGTSQKAAVKVQGKDNKGNVAIVQTNVERSLKTDLESTLKRQYFGNIQFKLSRVVLPSKVQNAIEDAQSAFAEVSQAQARIRSAQADATANDERQKGYDKCHACAQIDAIKAWKGTGVTTVVTGGAAVSVGGR